MRIDPQDGGLDDWIALAPVPAPPTGQDAPVMRIDPQDGGLDDWVLPAPAPARPLGQGTPVTAIDPRDGGLDDWIPPAPNRAARQGTPVMRIDPQDGGVDDWIAPALHPSPNTAQLAPGLQANAANPGSSNGPLSPAKGLPGSLAYLQSASSSALPLQPGPAVSMLPDWLVEYPPAASAPSNGLPIADAYGLLKDLADPPPTASERQADASYAPPALDQLATDESAHFVPTSGSVEAYPKVILVGGDEESREENEQKKFETGVLGGLTDRGLSTSPKAPWALPLPPPLEAPTPLPATDVAGRPVGRGVWNLPPTRRGRVLEQLFGHNLHPNYPTVDIWDPDSGTVTSLKSIDLDSSTYRAEGKNQNALYNTLNKYVNDLAEFQSAGYADIYIPEEAIKSRTLTVIVPSAGTAAQQDVMRRIGQLATQRGLTVIFKVYP
jgi:hypothetical protein